MKYTTEEAHRYFALTCNNQVWQLLANEGDTDEIINLAYASLWHWSKSPDCTKANLQRGEYLIALAYINAGQKEPALHHAQRCRQITKAFAAEMQEFDFTYSILIMAGALRLNEDPAAAAYLAEALKLAEQIKGEEDKRLFMEDLAFLKLT